MYEPFYIMKRTQQQLHQSAYEQFYKKNPKCNNIVGDFKDNFKYSTDINKNCSKAFSLSSLLTKILAKCIRISIKMGKNDFLEQLLPRISMHMAMKLLIQVSQNQASESNAQIIREILPCDLLSTFFSSQQSQDPKLAEIGNFLTGLIHASQSQDGSQSTQNANMKSAEQLMQEKKSAAAKKKALLLKKMKYKRQNTMNQFSAKVEVDAVLNKEAAMEDQVKTGIKELEMPQTKDAVMIDSK